ncbi:PREDICTED: condensin-2 complex subunit D3-like [Priapulus caudatus]|uniref:Condensin-2 complex subunit D3-like n=1 Tax=Priapulus caudatus TaxID=37621 RepID=A0ABM1F990_PRICU|nr:PREDICTED: condensin-2 complex subunit D3-like [Priapulus caudatus]
MAVDQSRTVEVLLKFSISQLNSDWVQGIWDNDFTEFEPLPPLYEAAVEDMLWSDLLTAATSTCKQWIQNGNDANQRGFWLVMSDNDVSLKGLVAVLFYLIERGHQEIEDSDVRFNAKLNAIEAAGLYCMLVSIPGSGAFKVFHPILYSRILDLTKIYRHPITIDSPVKKRKRNAGKRNAKPKSKRNVPTAAVVEEDEEDADAEEMDIDEDDEDAANTSYQEEPLSSEQTSALCRELLHLLRCLVVLLECYSLKECDESVEQTILQVAPLTRIEAETFHGRFRIPENLESVRNLPQLAYVALMTIMTSMHGQPDDLVRRVYKHLIPGILMLTGTNSSAVTTQTIPKQLLSIRDQCTDFVCFLMKRDEAATVGGTRILLQHMCTRVPDKAEYRARAAHAIVVITTHLPLRAYAQAVKWLQAFSRNEKIGFRVFAIEVVLLLLGEPERQPDDSVGVQLLPYLEHKHLVRLILGRCSDKAPTARAKALASFAGCVDSTDPFVRNAVRDLFTPHPGPRVGEALERTQECEVVLHDVLTESTAATSLQPPVGVVAATPALGLAPAGSTGTIPLVTPQCMTSVKVMAGHDITLSDHQGVVSMLCRRTEDEKSGVRKAAIMALQNVLLLDAGFCNQQNLAVIHKRCLDPALSVRKQALVTLSELLVNAPPTDVLQRMWLDGVLPMVMDRESSIEEKCMEVMEEVFLSNIVSHDRTCTPSHRRAWNMLNAMGGELGQELRRYLQKCCLFWTKQGKIKAALLNAIKSHVGTENNKGAWTLLAELAPVVSSFDADFAISYWRDNSRKDEDIITLQKVLKVIASMAGKLTAGMQQQLLAELHAKLAAFDSPPDLVSEMIAALYRICEVHGEERGRALTEQWCVDLLQACNTYLSEAILSESTAVVAGVDEDLVIAHLFTLGEVAQAIPARVPRRLLTIVESLIAAPTISAPPGAPPSQGDAASSEEEVPPSQDAFSQLSQFRGARMGSRVRAHAFITLGKLCLQNEAAAKRCVAALARELETSGDAVVRNNVAFVLCDLCVRYTSVGERHIASVAACLRDTSPLVRRQTLTLVTSLLQEDYVKWKGTLFFRYVTTTVDADADIASFAQFCLVNLLLPRNPQMFFNHFIECIFHFNCYENHAAYNKFTQSEREKSRFSLKGTGNKSMRMQVYKFLLEHMTDDQRFKLVAKLTQEVLGAIVDGTMVLDAHAVPLLQDSLAILCCKEIKLSQLRGSQSSADDMQGEQDFTAVAMATTKKTIISHVVKRNVIENIVPVVIALKHMLEQQRSPVVKDLMMYLKELMKDYRSEVKDIMAADKQLANEIEFDLRKFEQDQEEEKRQQRRQSSHLSGGAPPLAGGRAPGTPSARGPSRRMSRADQRSPAQRSSRGGSPAAAPLVTHGDDSAAAAAAAAHDMREARVVLRDINTPRNLTQVARKAIDSAQRFREQRSTPGRRQSIAPDRGASGDTPDTRGRLASVPTSGNESLLPPRTPQRLSGKGSRAISTPSRYQAANITFMPHDISAIPTTPISVRKVRPRGSPPEGTTTDMLCLPFLPDKLQPPPAAWNVEPPHGSAKVNLKLTEAGGARGRQRTRNAPGDAEAAVVTAIKVEAPDEMSDESAADVVMAEREAMSWSSRRSSRAKPAAAPQRRSSRSKRN